MASTRSSARSSTRRGAKPRMMGPMMLATLVAMQRPRTPNLGPRLSAPRFKPHRSVTARGA
eukprot:7299833-Pyramimonas_sp.AAC.1